MEEQEKAKPSRKSPGEGETPALAVRIPTELRSDAQAICDSEGMSLSTFIRDAVEDAVRGNPERHRRSILRSLAVVRAQIERAVQAGVVSTQIGDQMLDDLDGVTKAFAPESTPVSQLLRRAEAIEFGEEQLGERVERRKRQQRQQERRGALVEMRSRGGKVIHEPAVRSYWGERRKTEKRVADRRKEWASLVVNHVRKIRCPACGSQISANGEVLFSLSPQLRELKRRIEALEKRAKLSPKKRS